MEKVATTQNDEVDVPLTAVTFVNLFFSGRRIRVEPTSSSICPRFVHVAHFQAHIKSIYRVFFSSLLAILGFADLRICVMAREGREEAA